MCSHVSLSRVGSNAGTPPVAQESATPDWTAADVTEFVPQGFDTAHVVSSPKSPQNVVAIYPMLVDHSSYHVSRIRSKGVAMVCSPLQVPSIRLFPRPESAPPAVRMHKFNKILT